MDKLYHDFEKSLKGLEEANVDKETKLLTLTLEEEELTRNIVHLEQELISYQVALDKPSVEFRAADPSVFNSGKIQKVTALLELEKRNETRLLHQQRILLDEEKRLQVMTSEVRFRGQRELRGLDSEIQRHKTRVILNAEEVEKALKDAGDKLNQMTQAVEAEKDSWKEVQEDLAFTTAMLVQGFA